MSVVSEQVAFVTIRLHGGSLRLPGQSHDRRFGDLHGDENGRRPSNDRATACDEWYLLVASRPAELQAQRPECKVVGYAFYSLLWVQVPIPDVDVVQDSSILGAMRLIGHPRSRARY